MYSRTSARVCNNSCKGFRLRALLLEAGWELAMVEETRNIRREVLPNGLTLITEEMQHMPIAMDVLSDLVLNPVFDVQDIGRERGVILQEIKMDEDNPDYLVHEIFTQNFWKDHPLGKPILGTKDTVKKFEREPVLDFYKQRFAPGNLIICAAGHLQHEQFVHLVRKHFGDM